MAAITVQRAMRNATDAEFRAWGKAISDQLAAGGWVKTTDTEQIDWATVLAPAAVSTSQGYEVWRSNDATDTLDEIYLKIEYGSGAISASNISIWITVGWASDGAGNLTGTVSTRHQFSFSANSATLVNCNLAAGSAWFSLTLGTASNASGYFLLERSRNNALSEQNEIIVMVHSVTAASIQVISQTIAYPVEGVATGIFTMPNVTNSIYNGTVGLGLMFGQKGGLTNPLLGLFGCKSDSLGPAQSTVSITTYGAEHTYIVNPVVGSRMYFGTNTAIQVLTRFE